MKFQFNGHFAIISIMILIALLMTGCDATPSSKVSRTGTDGLKIFFSDANPQSIYEREEFGTMLLIKNLGSSDVTSDNPAILKVSYDNYRIFPAGGYLDDYRIPSTTSSVIEVPGITLFGKSQYYPIGDEKSTAFYFISNSLTRLREGATTTINFNLCYPYSTTLTTMTCIDTSTARNANGPSACKSEAYNGGSGQGAPIVISRIEPEILLQNNYVRPQFKIYIENRGDGYVTSNHRCSEVSMTEREFSGRVNVHAWLSGNQLECGPENSGSLRLGETDSYIRCSLPPGNVDYAITSKSYTTPLTVTVDYTYTSVNEWSVDIKRNDLLDEQTSQGNCGTYEVQVADRCMTKCEYCAKYPGDGICNDNGFSNVQFNKNFACGCDLSTCNNKLANGNCVKGYCPGSSYCCSMVKCDQYQIEYEGTCVDKCWYCSDIARKGQKDAVVCGSKDLSDFECASITDAQCNAYAQKGACVKGYCGGNNIDKYCANPSAAIVNSTL